MNFMTDFEGYLFVRYPIFYDNLIRILRNFKLE